MISEVLQKKLDRAKNQAACQKRRYDEVRARAIAELGGVCFYCQGTENLEIHDIVPILQGRGQRTGWGTMKRWLTLIPQGKMRLCCAECHVKHEHAGNTNELKKLKNGAKR